MPEMPLYCDHPLPVPDIATKPKLQVTASNLRKPRSHLRLAPAAIALYTPPAASPYGLPLLGYGPWPYLLNKPDQHQRRFNVERRAPRQGTEAQEERGELGHLSQPLYLGSPVREH